MTVQRSLLVTFAILQLTSIGISTAKNVIKPCVCSGHPATAVYPGPVVGGEPIGFIYKRDCVVEDRLLSYQHAHFAAVDHFGKIGYIKDDALIQHAFCAFSVSGNSTTFLTIAVLLSSLKPTVNHQPNTNTWHVTQPQSTVTSLFTTQSKVTSTSITLNPTAMSLHTKQQTTGTLTHNGLPHASTFSGQRSTTRSQSMKAYPSAASISLGTYAPTKAQSTSTDISTKAQSTGTHVPTKAQPTGTHVPTKARSTGKHIPTKLQSIGTYVPTKAQPTGTHIQLQSTGTHITTKIQPAGTHVPSKAQPTGTPYVTKSTQTTTSMVTKVQPTSQKPTKVPQCNKVALFNEIARSISVGTSQTLVCPDGTHHESDAAVTALCGAPKPSLWLRGIRVIDHCLTLPKYTPIAQFDHTSTFRQAAGIFLGCELQSVYMATQDCASSIHIMQVDLGSVSNSDQYYVVEW